MEVHTFCLLSYSIHLMQELHLRMTWIFYLVVDGANNINETLIYIGWMSSWSTWCIGILDNWGFPFSNRTIRKRFGQMLWCMYLLSVITFNISIFWVNIKYLICADICCRYCRFHNIYYSSSDSPLRWASFSLSNSYIREHPIVQGTLSYRYIQKEYSRSFPFYSL